MSRIRAVVFDLDGVLIDSERVWEASRRELAAATRTPYPERATRDVMGMSAPEWSRYLRDVVGIPLDPAEIDRRVVARVAEHYEWALPLLPDAVRVVRATAARTTIALASSSNRSLIDLVLARAGIAELFRAVVSSEEVARGKPAPDVYLRATELLGVSPASAVGVEDSSNGIRAAAAAGLTVVAMPNAEFPPTPDALALATRRIGGLADLGDALDAIERSEDDAV